ncbi:MAG: hypothetical protein LBB34_01590, partial [Holosporales bacterium]|nr:hypothetical protein [Holosporales bacterium]
LIQELEDLGINPANMNGYALADLREDMNAIYNPTPANDAALLSRGVTETTVVNNVKAKASFGICPHLALKIGYFISELKSQLYLNAGIMQLNGHLIPTTNNIYGIRNEKFKKITPFVTLGVARSITDNLMATVEVSHAFKITKKLQNIEIFRYNIENRASINRTDIKIMFIYKI